MEYTKEWKRALKNKDYRFKVKAEVGDKFLVLYEDNISFAFGTTIALDIDDRTGAPRFVDDNGAVDFCSWFKLKPIESWIPKQGDRIGVRNSFAEVSFKKEFISMTADNKYLCWEDNNIDTYNWNYAEEIKEESIMERRWKMLLDEKDSTTQTNNYYNQSQIDILWQKYYKGSYIDVELKDK